MKNSKSCNGVCCVNASVSSVHQSLNEMDFSRGIWCSALDGDIAKVSDFLKKPGFNADILDSAGYTSLHYAARAGHLDVCKLLLDSGANPNLATRAGHKTPLHRAVLKNHVGIVQLLLKYKADPFIRDADGCTPFHRASEQGSREMCSLFLALYPNLQ